MHRLIRSLLLTTALAALMAACGPQAPAGRAEGEPLKVVSTTGQIGDAVRYIAGESVIHSTLLGPGIDPHTYVATEGDLRTFQEADVIFYNGLHLEAQLERVLEQIGERSTTRVVALGDSLDEGQLLSWQPEAGFPHDPHVWNDVQLWKGVVEAIRDTLVEADAPNAESYTTNAGAYLSQLDELDSYIKAQAESLPAERRVIVTAHDAFNYFGRAYGFEVEAVQGISTAAEASTADIQALAAIVLERGVPAIFVESTISPRTIEAVQAAVRAAGEEVQVGGQLYSDALGAADGPAGSYIGMMRSNIDTIVAALSG
jgi:manganese/zinc/iron transport system substrate-binding protein